jgi:hypothetical protein
MAVYVDPLFDTRGWSSNWPYPEARHLMADTEEELHAAAHQIGMRRAWFQAGPPAHSVAHYDLTRRRRAKAVAFGAIEVSRGFTPARRDLQEGPFRMSHLAVRCTAGHPLQFVDEVWDAEAQIFVGESWCAICEEGYLDRRAADHPRPVSPSATCLHPDIQTMPCDPRDEGCDHDQICVACGQTVGRESWNFWATRGARADHDRKYSIDIPLTVCETPSMPRTRKTAAVPARVTATAVLDELTAAAETIDQAADLHGADYATVIERLTLLVPLVKSAQAAGVPVPPEVLAQLPRLPEIAAEYKTRHERKADDEKALVMLRAAVLDTLDDPTWNLEGVDEVPGDGFLLRRKPMPGRDKLDVGKLSVALVEKGLDPAAVTKLIEDCTTTGDPYFELRVVMAKDEAAA